MIFHVDITGKWIEKNKNVERAFSSIQDAYDRLILSRKLGEIDGSSQIYVHEGDYVLQKPLHFYGDVPVEIRPFEQDKVTISGGEPLTGWKKTKVNGRIAWKASVPEWLEDVPFLYVNGSFETPVRLPKKGFFRAADKQSGFQTNDDNCDNFLVNKGDFDPQWYDPENISIKMTHLWIEESMKVKSFDAKTGRLFTASSLRYVVRQENSEYALYNVKEALSDPGEFYFDRLKREILFVSDDVPTGVIVPRCGTLVRFDSNVKWVTLNGLHFRYGGTHLPLFDADFDLRDAGFKPLVNRAWSISVWKQGNGKKAKMPTYSGPQGASHVPGVLLFTSASDCTIQNCTVSASAWYGIHAAESCSNLHFIGNDIYGLGGGGIYVGGGNAVSVAENPSLLTSRIVIRDNHIHDCGLFFYSAIGILITHACGCLVENNHIHDLFYSGISCGWTWGYADSVTRENRICRNHIHDLGKGILSDMGGIYLLGVQAGTHVYENVIHDIVNRYYGGWGLYTDEGSSHIVLERNVVYNCACEGFHQHYGRENVVRYNVFAFNKAHGMAFSADAWTGYAWPGDPHDRAVCVYNNVVVTDGTPTYVSGNFDMFEKKRVFADNNIFFDVSGKQSVFAHNNQKGKDYTLDDLRALGMDCHSIVCDPGFKNVRKLDFRLKKNSVLLEYGFDFLEKLLK